MLAGEMNAADHGDGPPVLDVQDLRVHFPIRRGLLQRVGGYVRAVDGVSFSVARGEILGLVGESGCGKSTLGRSILRLRKPTAGRVLIMGQDVVRLRGRPLREMRRHAQIVFQDPYASVNPRMAVGDIVREPLEIHDIGSGSERRRRIAEILETVGLPSSSARRYPHEFSGGQLQRIGIARALILRPEFVVLDEPVSALDVSIQAQILNLLQDLQREFNTTLLFVAHDLGVVRQVCTRVAVMYLGRLAEIGPRDQLFAHPAHPYTAALLSAIPIPDPLVERKRRRIILVGDVPSPANPPSGCRFHTRCWLRERLGRPERCVVEEPELRQTSGGTFAACHFADDMLSQPGLSAGAVPRGPDRNDSIARVKDDLPG